MDLSYFNPHSQSEPDFLASFVARQETLNFFLQQIRLVTTGPLTHHHLIVAPRGYGKTSLLRRIAIAVRTEDDLKSRFIALTFREEQHNIISLDVFWRNCLQSMLEAREDEGAEQSEIDALDDAWTQHAPRQALAREEQDGEPAWDELRAQCEHLQRRPLLLIDNLDTLLEGLSPQHQWGLRKRLQSEDGPVLVSAAPRYPPSTRDPNAAFYDFFRVQTLDRLDDEQVMACLRSIARHRDERGRSVLQLLHSNPGRVASLNTLAGGNPRTLSVLYSVLESHMSADLLSQLSAMLDTFTGWYQARTEELPVQARAVFDALALNWDPMTAAALGLATGLDTPSVSSQLTRLEKMGYVETVALSTRKKGRSGYQVCERFFNIWYLMRNGPRRAKQKIRFLTVFLQSCFSVAERRSLAQGVLRDSGADPSYALAIASSLRDGPLRQQMLEPAYTRSNELGLVEEYAQLIDGLRKAAGQGPVDLQINPQGLAVDTGANDDDMLIARADSTLDPALRDQVARALVKKGIRLGSLGRSEEAIEVYDEVAARFGTATELALLEQVAWALAIKGLMLEGLGRSEEAIEVYDQVVARFGAATEPALLERVASALVNKGITLGSLGRSEEAIEVYDQVVARFGAATEPALLEQVARALSSKANLLVDFEGDPGGAQEAYKSGLAVVKDVGLKALLHANLAYALALHFDDRFGARSHLASALADGVSVSPAGRALLEALLVWSDSEEAPWARVFEGIGKAVASEDPALWADYADDLQRLLWFVIAKGEGDRFKCWMEEAQYPNQYAPLYHAFVAALEGEDHLLKINLETRQPAATIHLGIARLLKLYGSGVAVKHKNTKKRPPA